MKPPALCKLCGKPMVEYHRSNRRLYHPECAEVLVRKRAREAYVPKKRRPCAT